MSDIIQWKWFFQIFEQGLVFKNSDYYYFFLVLISFNTIPCRTMQPSWTRKKVSPLYICILLTVPMFSFLVITAVSFPVGCIFAVATCLPFKRSSQSWPCQKDAEVLLSNALFLSQFLANKITVLSSTIVSFSYHVQLYLFITFMMSGFSIETYWYLL